MIIRAGIVMFDMMAETHDLQDRLHQNTDYFRNEIIKAGFTIKPSKSAIVAIMLFDARLSQNFAAQLLEEGIYAIGFYYPIVPKGEARIRVQLSAAHTRENLDQAIKAFVKVGRKLQVI
jgi:glycine C-acetyltransferase